MRDLFGPQAHSPGQSPDESQANAIVAPNPPEDGDLVEPIERYRGLMVALYGSDFPLIRAFDQLTSNDETFKVMGQMPTLEQMLPLCEASEWASWVRGRWSLHAAAVQMHLYLVARNRLFRARQQWVSSRNNGPWQTPAKSPESVRMVCDIIGPALDQRIQTITDQRPSFQVDPSALSPDEKRKAEGRQQALEFQYDQQEMERQTREAAYWAGTDGVAFWETRWDRDRGPWDEKMGNVPNQRKPLGDLKTQTRRCEQVRVSANATANEKPYYAIVRDVIPETESAYLYGAAGVQPHGTSDSEGNSDNDSPGNQSDGILPSWVLTQTIVGEGYRLSNVKTVERFTMYVDKHPDVLPDGLQVVILGHNVVWGPGELLFGCIPIVAIRDGSTDPSYYCRPIMEQWIPPQMGLNSAVSLWVNSARVNAGGRILAKPDAISRETFVGGGLSIVEVEGPGNLGEMVLPIQGFSVGQDIKDLVAFFTKQIEDMSGYNDVSRGEVSNETATAVAAANEHIQRVFAPPVQAIATGFTEWSKINLAAMAWGYDIPRDVGAVGADRPDLARALSAKDFDGPSTVIVDAEKLLPMPKVYRLQIMDDWFNRGLITAQQYMRNVKFGSFKNLSTPDEDQEARAKRIADAIRTGQPIPQKPQAPPPMPVQDPNVPQDPMAMQQSMMAQQQYQMASEQYAAQPMAIRWTDNEAIHQDVLEREILLHDDLDPQIIAIAMQRWKDLAAQAAEKQGAMVPQAPPAPGGGEPPHAPGTQPSPSHDSGSVPPGAMGGDSGTPGIPAA
jgi:hypothetical protein